MTTETGTFTPTDEDVERAARAIHAVPYEVGEAASHFRRKEARAALATIGPIIERERRAAKAEALREAADVCRLRHGMDSTAGAELLRRADEIVERA